MAAQWAMPCPLEKMFEHLDLDIARGFQTVPMLMEEAMATCRTCKMLNNCDHDIESRYFLCPNRDILDELERLQGKT